MKYIYKMLINILIFLCYIFECQALHITVQPFRVETLFSRANTLFCMFRHAPTAANQENIVQGRSIDNEILEYIPQENKVNYSLLSSLLFDRIVTSTQRRTLLTAQLLSSKSEVVRDARFDEQDLGPFEGKDKHKVFRDPQFRQLSTHPEFCLPQVEPGIEVIERVHQGIDAFAKNNSIIGICTSQCVMNWFLKWANNDYSSFYTIKNFDFIFFLYNKNSKIITIIPNSIKLGMIAFLFNNNSRRSIFPSEKINIGAMSLESQILLQNKLGIRESEKMKARLITSSPYTYRRYYDYRRMTTPFRGG